MCWTTTLSYLGACQKSIAVDCAMNEVLGPRVEGLRVLIKANFRPSWADIPPAETIVLWLRNNLPEHADEILDRARRYCQGTRPAERADAPI